MKTPWVLLLITLGLVGCHTTTEEPPFAARELPTPEQFAGAPATLVEESGSERAWWDHFDDPTLDALILEALAFHPDLRAAAARVAAASAVLEAAGTLSWPELSGSLSANRQRQNFIGIDIPGSDDVLSSTTTSFGASLSARWEIDLWGRLAANERVALSNELATRAEVESLRLSLSGQVALAWFALIEAERQLELATANRDRRQASEESIATRAREGLRGTLDLRLARTETASAEVDVVTAERSRSQAARALELLLGRYPAEEISAVTQGSALPLPTLTAAIPLGVPAELLTRRPDLVAARARLAAAGADRDRAEADLWPQLVLTASGGRLSEELSDLLDGDFTVWSLAGSLVGPIFDHGRRRAEVSAADARRQEARAQFAGSVLRAFGEVEAALRDEGWLAIQEDRVAELFEETTRTRDVAEEQYQRGLIDLLPFLDAERTAAASERELLRIARARLENRVRFLVALGGPIPPVDPPTFELVDGADRPSREERAP